MHTLAEALSLHFNFLCSRFTRCERM